ncbi:MAG: hypothetical protein HYR88_17105 [Verrucomicrobia bacterium]|nr:hypothetical protein [Verrucomicrobiota bacterium]MBI3870135.1 hypothetical protein [Verrucomicrobiota bacterium]
MSDRPPVQAQPHPFMNTRPCVSRPSFRPRPALERLAALILAIAATHRMIAAEPEAPAAKAAAIPVATLSRTTPVDFEKEVLPIFRANCLACHNRTKAKADLILETPADLKKGGESGPAITTGKSEASLLLKVAAHRDKPFMPPKDNKVEAVDLTPEQLGLLKLWIDQGATGEVRGVAVVEWQALPPGVNPILSLAMTEDAQIIACGRANQISLYHIPSQRLLDRLVDPDLQKSGLYPKEGVAHRDLVNALAFSPDGSWLASGDYRAAKLWQRTIEENRLELKAPSLKRATTLATSPQGDWYATGHEDGVIALWDAASGQLRTQWIAHAHAIQKTAFSPDGKRILSVSGSLRVGVWSAEDGASVAWIETPTNVSAAAWHPDGKRIATAGEDRVLRLWQPPAGPQTNATLVMVKEMKGHDARISCLEFAAGETPLLISGSSDGSIRVWSAEKGEMLRKADFGAAVAALAVSTDGSRMAAIGSNAVAKVWRVADAQKVAEVTGDPSTDEAVGRGERAVGHAKEDIGYRQGVLDEAKKRSKTESDFAAKALDTRVTAERTLTDKQKAVLTAVEARAAAEKAPAELAAELLKAAADRDAVEAQAKQAEAEATAARRRIDDAKATADAAQKAAKELDAAAKSDAGKTPALAAAKATAEKLATAATQFLADAKAVADRFAKDAEPKRKAAEEAKVAAQKKSAEIAEKQKQVPEKLTAALKSLDTAEKEHDTALNAKRSAEDQLASAQRASKKASDAVPEAETALQAAQTALKKAEEQTASARKASSEGRRPFLALAFSQDGVGLLTAGSNLKLQSWGSETGLGMRTSSTPEGGLIRIATDKRGAVLTLGTNGVPVKRVHQERWILARTLGGDDPQSPLKGRVNALQFSPDGGRLAIGSGEPSRSGELNLWEVSSGKMLRSFTNAHSDVVLAVDFSPDGTLLASAASDRFVKVWSLDSGALARSFEGHTHHVLGVSWRQDGRTLASAGADKVIKLWNFVTGEQKKTIGGAEKEVTSICYVDATNEALVTSGDSQVRLVADDGKTVRSFGGATDFVQSAAVTRDGKWVVGGGQDSVLRIWNGLTGQLVKSFGP